MVNHRNVIISRPNANSGLQYTVLLEDLGNFARANGYNTIELVGNDTVPERIYYEINTRNPYFLFHVGHGEITITTTQYLLDLFWIPTNIRGHEHSDSNVHMLKDMVVYLLSCRCGYPGGLLENMAKYAKAAVGYSNYWYWVIDSSKSPRDDPYAKSFFKAAGTFVTSFLGGKSVDEAINDMYNAYTQEANYWIDVASNPNNPQDVRVAAMLCAYYLTYDRDIMVAYGDVNQRIVLSSAFPIVAVAGLLLFAFKDKLFKK